MSSADAAARKSSCPTQLHLPQAADQRREAQPDEEHDGEEATLVGARPAVAGAWCPRRPHPYLRRARPRSAATTSGTTSGRDGGGEQALHDDGAEVDRGAHGERAQHPDTLDDRRRAQRHQGDAGCGDRPLEAQRDPRRRRRRHTSGPARRGGPSRAGTRSSSHPAARPTAAPATGPRSSAHATTSTSTRSGTTATWRAPSVTTSSTAASTARPRSSRASRARHPVPVAAGRGVLRPAVSTTATTSSEVGVDGGGDRAGGGQPADCRAARWSPCRPGCRARTGGRRRCRGW